MSRGRCGLENLEEYLDYLEDELKRVREELEATRDPR
jgi:hypothetical protein